MKYFAVFIVLFWGLSGCSSSGSRAPVSDLTLSKSKHSAPSKSSSKSSFSAKKLKNYKVKAGDTLYAIAWKSDLDVKTLVKRNNLKPPYTIYEGQILNLIEKKQQKPSKAKKTTAKSDLSSQKIDKNASTHCTGQSCNKNSNEKVVQKKTKAYSANKADGKVAKTTIKNKQTNNKKVSVWRWPAKGKLTKTFSSSQVGMKGISLVNQRGTAIYATTSGKVVYAGSGLRGYGNLIIIKHNYDYLSAYAHNEKLLVRENEKIKVGQKIAIMGDSGTESVHLHFEIRYRGKSVDPLRYLPKR